MRLICQNQGLCLTPPKRRSAKPSRRSNVICRNENLSVLLDAGPKTETPDYTSIDRSFLNLWLMSIFRKNLVQVSGEEDSKIEGFEGIIDLTRRLNDSKINTPEETRSKALKVLRSLFPVWFTRAVAICIVRPFPAFAAQLNAWTTRVACKWLMGEMIVNDIEKEDGTIGMRQGVLVERCRFLEMSGCASICHNSCKIPTQQFFQEAMEVDVTLEPNYEDFSCQFSFGKKPLPLSEDPVLQTPCFVQCPTKKRFAPNCSNVSNLI